MNDEKYEVVIANFPKRNVDVESAVLVTEWLKPELKCGATGFVGVATNIGWCRAEVDRLGKKNIFAAVLRRKDGSGDNWVAVAKFSFA